MKTQAIVIPEPNRVELREVELTEPGPDDLVVRTAYTSISAGTERMLLAYCTYLINCAQFVVKGIRAGRQRRAQRQSAVGRRQYNS